MAIDENLVQRMREALDAAGELREVKMFGGLCFMLNGNMLAVALGDGHGNFSVGRDYVGTGMSYSLAIADFNGDGRPDVVSASPDTDTATVYINDGSGGFGFPQGEWIGLPGIGSNVAAPISVMKRARSSSPRRSTMFS